MWEVLCEENFLASVSNEINTLAAPGKSPLTTLLNSKYHIKSASGVIPKLQLFEPRQHGGGQECIHVHHQRRRCFAPTEDGYRPWCRPQNQDSSDNLTGVVAI